LPHNLSFGQHNAHPIIDPNIEMLKYYITDNTNKKHTCTTAHNPKVQCKSITENKNTTTLADGNPGPDLGQTHKCGGVKPVDRTSIISIVIIGSTMVYTTAINLHKFDSTQKTPYQKMITIAGSMHMNVRS
jgi:hypothetical protein